MLLTITNWHSQVDPESLKLVDRSSCPGNSTGELTTSEFEVVTLLTSLSILPSAKKMGRLFVLGYKMISTHPFSLLFLLFLCYQCHHEKQ